MIFDLTTLRNFKKLLTITSLVISMLLCQYAPAAQLYAAVSYNNGGLVIYQLQTGSVSSASQEYVAIYNNSDQSIDITNHCIVYVSASGVTQTQLACYTPPDSSTRIYLPSYQTSSLASSEFVRSLPNFVPDLTFSPGIATASGHIKLLDVTKNTIDALGWGSASNPEATAATAHGTGKILQRNVAEGRRLVDSNNNAADFSHVELITTSTGFLYEEKQAQDICPNITGLQDSMPDGYLHDTIGSCRLDVCVNIDGLQLIVPQRFSTDEHAYCTQSEDSNRVLFLSEILANPEGSDSGKEYIELYNPHNQPVELSGYSLQVGPGFSKVYPLPELTLPAHAYKALTDTQTKITLPNTTASIRLVAPSGDIVSVSESYQQPGDNVAWAFFSDGWYETYELTPNAPNMIVSSKPCAIGYDRSMETGHCRLISTETEATGGVCLPGQERNPETGRCRKIVASAVQAACKINQVRNPETGRCRAIITSTSTTNPCKSDQERNPETGRCRKKATDTAPKACPVGQERSSETNRCRKAAGSGQSKLTSVKDVATPLIQNNAQWWLAGIGGLGSVGYGVYEWRREVGVFVARIKGRFTSLD